MLKQSPPEPPADLMLRILQQTSGEPVSKPFAVPAAAVAAPATGGGWNRRWAVARSRMEQFLAPETLQAILSPRMAMTAAMAFFSIALTLNLTGVHLSELHAQNLSPASLHRTFADARASLTRTVQNNRVVYQLESQAEDLRVVRGPGAEQ